jgi:hypothetical protein
MQLLENIRLFPHALRKTPPGSYGVARELACLITAPAL